MAGFLGAPAHAALETAVTDLDGDGRSDLLWRNGLTGQVYRIPMTALVAGAGGLIYTESDRSWKIVADGDFNGDGRSDLVWRHDLDGRIYIMTMGAGGMPAGGAVVHAEADMRWRIVATPDFDGDGRADLVWWNESSGTVHLMVMDGFTIVSQGSVFAEPNTQWRIVGGETRMLMWRNQETGQVYRQAYHGNPGAFTTSGSVIYTEPNTAWKILALADFNADGGPDLLWRNDSTGQVFAHLLSANGATLGGGMLHTEGNPDWQIVATGDYDGDGRTDLVWRNFSTGQVYGMRVEGTAVTAQGMVYSEPQQLWRILGAHDYSQDDRIEGSQAGLALAAANAIPGTYVVPASCATNPRINCGGNVPAPTSATLELQGGGISGTPPYDMSFNLQAAAAGIRVDYDDPSFGTFTCFVAVNAAAGTGPWQMTGTVMFGSPYSGGYPINRIMRTVDAPGNIEDADLAITGDFACAAASSLLKGQVKPYLADLVSQSLTREYCGAPGPQLYTTCATLILSD